MKLDSSELYAELIFGVQLNVCVNNSRLSPDPNIHCAICDCEVS